MAKEEFMTEEQREAMFNAWKNSKPLLIAVVKRTEDSVTVSTIHNSVLYSKTMSKENDFVNMGYANYYNQAFNSLLTELKRVDKNIELQYDFRQDKIKSYEDYLAYKEDF